VHLQAVASLLGAPAKIVEVFPATHSGLKDLGLEASVLSDPACHYGCAAGGSLRRLFVLAIL
jgi:hypothetical protein